MFQPTTLATYLILGALLTVGCDGETVQQSDVPPRSYEMRGIVRQISASDAAQRQIWIHHEAIPEFLDIRGNSAPMEAMTMPFHLSESLVLPEVEPGDKVVFRLDVDWSASVPARIGALALLPSETRLAFEDSDAESPSETPAEHDGH